LTRLISSGSFKSNSTGRSRCSFATLSTAASASSFHLDRASSWGGSERDGVSKPRSPCIVPCLHHTKKACVATCLATGIRTHVRNEDRKRSFGSPSLRKGQSMDLHVHPDAPRCQHGGTHGLQWLGKCSIKPKFGGPP
jgi:hypothetical protein